MSWFYSREPGDEGQILTEQGQPSGVPLRELLAGPALPLRAALELVACLADALSIAEEDQAIHGDLDDSAIFVQASGAVSVSGYGRPRGLTSAPEGRPAGIATDVYALGIVLHAVLGGEPMGTPPRDRDGHDDHVVDRLMRLDWGELAEKPWMREVRTFLCSMLAFEPGERPAPLDVANVLFQVAAQAPGKDLAAWAARAVPGAGGARAPRAPRPMIEEMLEGPQELGGPVSGTSGFKVRQAGSAKGQSTAIWSREKIAAMLADDDEPEAPAETPVRQAWTPPAPPAGPPPALPPSGPPLGRAAPPAGPPPSGPPAFGPPPSGPAPSGSPLAGPPPSGPPASGPPPFGAPGTPVAPLPPPGGRGPVAQGPVAQGPVAQGPVAQGPVAQASPGAPAKAQAKRSPLVYALGGMVALVLVCGCLGGLSSLGYYVWSGRGGVPWTPPATGTAGLEGLEGEPPSGEEAEAPPNAKDTGKPSAPATPAGASGGKEAGASSGRSGSGGAGSSGSSASGGSGGSSASGGSGGSSASGGSGGSSASSAGRAGGSSSGGSSSGGSSSGGSSSGGSSASSSSGSSSASSSSGSGSSASSSSGSGSSSSSARGGSAGSSTSGGSTGGAATSAGATESPGGSFAVKFVAASGEATVRCGDGQGATFMGSTSLRFSGLTTCVVLMEDARGAVQVDRSATVTCSKNGTSVSCAGS